MRTLLFTDKIKELIATGAIQENELARVVIEHKERYTIQTCEGMMNAEITGNLRFSAQSRANFPAVGDWVRFMKMDEENAIIIELLPRISVLERQAIGKQGEIQIIASNIDYAFIVQAVGHDFNLNRIERYLTICHSANIKPVVILTKIDLATDLEIQQLVQQVSDRNKGISIFALSNKTGIGYNELETFLEAGKTFCFLGSSGVGKSTIINHLLGNKSLKTQEISSRTSKGKHTTSHRELFVLPNKSIVIDTPGMRELGVTDQSGGIESTFDQISELARQCRFGDCTHTSEKGCAVIKAVESGNLSEDRYENFLKLKREQEHFSSSVHEKRQKDKKFGKMVNEVKRHKKNLNPKY